MEVICYCDECIHRDPDVDPFCEAGQIVVGGKIEGENKRERPYCMNYQSYKALPEYQSRFYKLEKMKDGPGALPCMGKKITIRGVDFYTDDHPALGEYIRITHGASGLSCDTRLDLEKKWGTFQQILRDRPPRDIRLVHVAERIPGTNELFLIRDGRGNPVTVAEWEKIERGKERAKFIKKGDLVRWHGEVYKVLNVRTERNNGLPQSTAKLRKGGTISWCAPVDELEKIEQGGQENGI